MGKLQDRLRQRRHNRSRTRQAVLETGARMNLNDQDYYDYLVQNGASGHEATSIVRARTRRTDEPLTSKVPKRLGYKR